MAVMSSTTRLVQTVSCQPRRASVRRGCFVEGDIMFGLGKKQIPLVVEDERAVNELEQVHSLLDSIEVPRIVSPGAAYERDKAYDRLVWLLHQSVGQKAYSKMLEKLKSQTHPWAAVRWVKENL